MAKKDLKEARQSINQLMQVLQVTKVIFVDDYFEDQIDVEIIIGWLVEGGDKVPQDVLEKVGVNFSLDYEIWAREIRTRWDGFNQDLKREVTYNISEAIGKSIQEDRTVVSNLEKLFQVQTVFLSPTQWTDAKKDLLSDLTIENRALCLFDHDLSVSRGFTPTSGIGLVRDTKAEYGENVICCLLTHTIPSINGEITAWRDLSVQSSLDLRDFLPLAKLRVRGDDSFLLFVDGLKKAALNVHCEDLKKAVKNVVSRCHREAIKDLEKIDVYDFDFMILRVSNKEGIWETETLMRVIQIFERDTLLKLMSSKYYARKINDSLEHARKISAIKVSKDIEYKYPQVRPLRRKELYENSETIAHSPIQLGDIFQLEGKETQFILLGQPCDLMVRSTGKRSASKLVVPLVLIEKKTTSDIKKITDKYGYNYWRTHTTMDYYFPDPNDFAIVSFSKGHYVSVDVLDLAVINPTGSCSLDLNKGISEEKLTNLPSQFTFGWIKRSENLVKKYINHHKSLSEANNHIAQLEESVRGSIWQSLMPLVTMAEFGLNPVPYKDGVFDYKQSRVARLREPGASRLLKLFSQYQSRDADDVDFAKDMDS